MVKEKIIAGFNRGAKTYTQAAQLQAYVAKNLADKLPKVAAQHILEIGCGTGLFSQYLIKSFPGADFLLTDISPFMLEQCGRQLVNAPQAKLICMDGEQLNLSSSFDLITSSMVLHWFKEFDVSLINIKKKLKKGGRLIFATLTENSLQEWHDMCLALNYPIATPIFPSVKHLQEKFPQLKLTVEKIKEVYADAYSFLRTLKFLGATATRKNYIALTPAKLRKLIQHFSHKIEITYEVIYGEYVSL